MRRRTTITLLVTAIGLLGLAGPATALAAPVLKVESSHILSDIPPGGNARYALAVSNTGDAATSGNLSVDFEVPAGLRIISATDEVSNSFGFPIWGCTIAGDERSVSCTGPEFFGIPGFPEIGPGEEACVGFFQAEFGEPLTCRILLKVKGEESLIEGETLPVSAEACGGGAAACATASDPIQVGTRDFRLTHFDGAVNQENGDPATQAGSHPFLATTTFNVTRVMAEADNPEFGPNHGGPLIFPTEDIDNAIVKLPPGLVGNPQALDQCTEGQLVAGSAAACSDESQVGTVAIWFDGGKSKHEPTSEADLFTVPVYNMVPPHGTPAVFAFNFGGAAIQIYASLRTGEDYGVTVTQLHSPETLPFEGVTFDFWGVPAEPSHDAERGECDYTDAADLCPSLDAANPKPFLSLPTSCVGPVETTIEVTSWLGSSDTAGFLSHDNSEPPNPIGADGCNAVDFNPTLEARPTTNVADAASGLDVDLHVPQSEDPNGTAEAQLKDTTVTLPQGMTINPSGANGLGSCSEAQFGYTETDAEETIHTTPDPASCPDASKVGTVEVDTPLIDHPLRGAVYIAAPHQNPFGSLLALYLAVDDPQTGIVVKLAGEAQTDPTTGQVTTTFKQNPQQPFEDFKLHFFGGSGGTLRTPPTCGTYQTTSVLTPWTAPEGQPASPVDAWQIEQAPGGGTCPTSSGQEPNSPSLDAGSISPVAALATPTVVNLRREDGSQEFSTISLTLPPGLTGKLAGISQCPDAALAGAAGKSGREEEASPSCPSNSRIGTVDVAAGAGPAPYNAHGTAYLTGPYKGAPLGMAIITPAVAGPFDLGTVVVRVALYLDPSTGQITATSDPLPHILQGIPLDIRSARVLLDRPDFTRNGTSCNPSAFTGRLTSTLGSVASLSNRFQLGECTALAFKPKLAIKLKGGTKRGAHPALTGIAQLPEGGANIARASIALPKSEFLDQGHIGTVCTRVQFAEGAGNGAQCPPASIYGQARATSPLVDYTLEGPVFLRSSEHELPDLVAALHGPASQPIAVDVAARIDSVKGGIRSTFEGVPDLPVSTFTLEMQGGAKGLLQNSTNICKGVHKATAELDGQNGKAADLFPALKDSKCPKARKGHKRHPRRHRVAR